jgi:hypothetical protein
MEVDTAPVFERVGVAEIAGPVEPGYVFGGPAELPGRTGPELVGDGAPELSEGAA